MLKLKYDVTTATNCTICRPCCGQPGSGTLGRPPDWQGTLAGGTQEAWGHSLHVASAEGVGGTGGGEGGGG